MSSDMKYKKENYYLFKNELGIKIFEVQKIQKSKKFGNFLC